MAEDLFSILSELPHRLVEDSPPFLGELGYGGTTRFKEPTFRLVQAEHIYKVKGCMDAVVSEGWAHPDRYFLTHSPNQTYAARVLDQGKQALIRAEKVLNPDNLQEAQVWKRVVRPLKRSFNRALHSLHIFTEETKAVPATLDIPLEEYAARRTIQSRMVTAETLQKPELAQVLLQEKGAVTAFARCDRNTTRVYGAVCVARTERAVANQIPSLLYCLGIAIPILLMTVSEQSIFPDVQEDPLQIARNLVQEMAISSLTPNLTATLIVEGIRWMLG